MKYKKLITNFFLLFFSFTISLFCIELGLRFYGYQPYSLRPVGDLKVEPGGRLHANHPILGYTHLPGVFKVTFSDGYMVSNTHLSNTLRITHPLDTYNNKSEKEQIWVFGGSFTYGWSINDIETFPWLIQESFPQYEVVNFGVGGYGTVHSLLQYQEARKLHNPPKIAVLAYASFHDERTAFLRSWRKRMLSYDTPFYLKTYPYARFDDNGKLIYHIDNIEYREFPLMRYSALVHLIEETYNGYEDVFIDSHAISRAVIKDFSETVKQDGVIFIIAGIVPESRNMLEYSKTQDILAVDISVDLDIPGNRNTPHDSHPSAMANQQYAKKLEEFLKANIQ